VELVRSESETGDAEGYCSRRGSRRLVLGFGDERVPQPVRADTRLPDSRQLSTLVGGAAPFVPIEESDESACAVLRLPQSVEAALADCQLAPRQLEDFPRCRLKM
jgi:hypothetical protein